MNKRTLITIIPAAALLLLAACTQDEPGGQGNELPYGEYPLQISGVTLDVESSDRRPVLRRIIPTARAACGNGMARK